jgi:hypothetical protein
MIQRMEVAGLNGRVTPFDQPARRTAQPRRAYSAAKGQIMPCPMLMVIARVV